MRYQKAESCYGCVMELPSYPALVVVVMGVSGSGKTTVGRAVADALGWPFHEGDDFHPQSNVAKMSRGEPLTDADRYPWLAALHDLIADSLERNQSAVLACSALKQQYRERLLDDNDGTMLVYLRGSYDLIRKRMTRRHGHFMKAGMLRSQFDALEEPTDAFVIDVNDDLESSVASIVQGVRQRLGAREDL